jgi:hypothetical protein
LSGPFTSSNTVGQIFKSFADYSQVTGAVTLSTTGSLSANASASFYVAIDSNGAPGVPLASADIVVTHSQSGTTYQLPFENLTLLDGQIYWLVASSSSFFIAEPSKPVIGSVPVWIQSTDWGGPLALSANAGPWELVDRSTAFAMYGTETGNPIDNGSGVLGHVISVSEPEIYALMLAGFGALGFTWRRRNKQRERAESP